MSEALSNLPPQSYFEEQAALQLLVPRAKLLAALADAYGAEPAAPVLFVSPEQLSEHSDPDAEHGRYLPARKTPAGKFTQPLYALPPAAPAVPEALGAPGEVVKAIREYLGVHPDLVLCGQVLDSMALELSRIALDYPADLIGALALEELMQLGYTVEAGAILPPRDLPEQACEFFGVRPVGQRPAKQALVDHKGSAEHQRAQFELAYAVEWAKSREGGEPPEQLAAQVKTWRSGNSYGNDLPRLRFGWEGYQWAMAGCGGLAQIEGPTLSLVERQALDALCAVALAARHVADDSPYDGNGTVPVEHSDMEALIGALDKLDSLPDDQPGYLMDPAAKAAWALRRLLDAAPAMEAPAAPAVPSEAEIIALLGDPKFSGITAVREALRRWGAAAPQAPDCARCSGSGEDPDGYLTHGRGPDDHTVDGPCRSCDGTGAAPQAPAAPSASNWIAADDVARLVRELDVALHGEADAAPQASLCDIVGLAKAAAGKLGRPVLAVPAVAARVQWWLASLDKYGNPTLTDGAHSDRAGADKAAYLIAAMNLGPGKKYAVARVELTEPRPSADGVNHKAVALHNRAAAAQAAAKDGGAA